MKRSRNVLIREAGELLCPRCDIPLADVVYLYTHAAHCQPCRILYARTSSNAPVNPADEDSDWRIADGVGDPWLCNIPRRLFRHLPTPKRKGRRK